MKCSLAAPYWASLLSLFCTMVASNPPIENTAFGFFASFPGQDTCPNHYRHTRSTQCFKCALAIYIHFYSMKAVPLDDVPWKRQDSTRQFHPVIQMLICVQLERLPSICSQKKPISKLFNSSNRKYAPSMRLRVSIYTYQDENSVEKIFLQYFRFMLTPSNTNSTAMLDF